MATWIPDLCSGPEFNTIGAAPQLACINDDPDSPDGNYLSLKTTIGTIPSLYIEFPPSAEAVTKIELRLLGKTPGTVRVTSILIRDGLSDIASSVTPVLLVEGVAQSVIFTGISSHVFTDPRLYIECDNAFGGEDLRFYAVRIVTNDTPSGGGGGSSDWGSFEGSGWIASGTAGSVVEGVATADDGGYAQHSGSTGGIAIGLDLALLFEAPVDPPTGAMVTIKTGNMSGTRAVLTWLIVRDAAGALILQAYPFRDIGDDSTEYEFSLDLLYADVPDDTDDWRLELQFLVEGSYQVELDYVAIDFDAGGGGSGPGPGGQLSRNAAILIPTMVQP